MIYKIIDNFLNKKEFNDISDLIMDGEANTDFLWKYVSDIEGLKIHTKKSENLFYMIHKLYDVDMLHKSYESFTPVKVVQEYKDSYYEILDPIFSVFKEMGLTKFWRIKCNLFPNTKVLQEHAYHVDHKIKHVAAILVLNTCDGYTKFKDGTKVDSIANRLYFFEGGIDHASTTTTNVPARFNINFNFAHSVESWRKNE